MSGVGVDGFDGLSVGVVVLFASVILAYIATIAAFSCASFSYAAFSYATSAVYCSLTATRAVFIAFIAAVKSSIMLYYMLYN